MQDQYLVNIWSVIFEASILSSLPFVAELLTDFHLKKNKIIK